MTEQWIPIPGWENRYEASSLGRIRSADMVCRSKCGSTAVRKGRILTQVQKGGRYFVVTLAEGHRRKQYLVHDLIMLAFEGPKPKGQVVCHYDDNKENNALGNLRYDTVQANEADAKRNGKKARGEKHPMSKLTKDAVIHIRCSKEPTKYLSKKYGVTTAHISAIRAMRVWKDDLLDQSGAR